MTQSRSWRDIVELIGIFAVVASLIFVGVQLRQDQQIAVAQLYADFDDTQIELSRLLIENEDVWLRGSNKDELSDLERFRFEAVAEAVIAKHTGFISRAMRLKTQPTEDYVVRFAALLHSLPGMGAYYRNRCEYAKQLGLDGSYFHCTLVLASVSAFEQGLRQVPESDLISP